MLSSQFVPSTGGVFQGIPGIPYFQNFRAEHFAQAGNVQCIRTPFTKEQIGGAVGRGSCAMAALTDAGLAASLLKKLAQEEPEQYGEAAAALDVKAQKVLQRQREKRQHEKNIANGKQKPWAVPPKSK